MIICRKYKEKNEIKRKKWIKSVNKDENKKK